MWRLFALGILLVALAASLEAAPRVLVVGGALPREGSVLDNSSLGMSLAAGYLASHGHRVLLGTGLPRDGGPVAVVVAGPAACGPGEAASLASSLLEASKRGRVLLVLAASPPYDSCLSLLDRLGAPLAVAGQAQGVYLAAGRLPAGSLVLVLLDPSVAAQSPGWRVAALALGSGGDRVPGLLVSRPAEGLTVVYIPDWRAFTNAVVEAASKAGLNQAEALRVIVDSYAGPGAPVVQPAQLYPEPPRAGVAFQPGLLLARLLEHYSRLEAAVLSRVSGSPALWLVFSWTLALTASAAVLAALGGASAEAREEPLLRLPWRRRGRGSRRERGGEA